MRMHILSFTIFVNFCFFSILPDHFSAIKTLTTSCVERVTSNKANCSDSKALKMKLFVVIALSVAFIGSVDIAHGGILTNIDKPLGGVPGSGTASNIITSGVPIIFGSTVPTTNNATNATANSTNVTSGAPVVGSTIPTSQNGVNIPAISTNAETTIPQPSTIIPQPPSSIPQPSTAIPQPPPVIPQSPPIVPQLPPIIPQPPPIIPNSAKSLVALVNLKFDRNVPRDKFRFTLSSDWHQESFIEGTTPNSYRLVFRKSQ